MKPFEMKIAQVDIRKDDCANCEGEHGGLSCAQRFLDYEGGCNLEAGRQYFEKKFQGLKKSKTASVYVHSTCATNTDNVKHVIGAVMDIVMKSNMAMFT